MTLDEEDAMYSIKDPSKWEQRVNTLYPLIPEWEPYKAKEEGSWLT